MRHEILLRLFPNLFFGYKLSGNRVDIERTHRNYRSLLFLWIVNAFASFVNGSLRSFLWRIRRLVVVRVRRRTTTTKRQFSRSFYAPSRHGLVLCLHQVSLQPKHVGREDEQIQRDYQRENSSPDVASSTSIRVRFHQRP